MNGMNRASIKPQEVLDMANYLFGVIEDTEVRNGIVQLATALLLPEIEYDGSPAADIAKALVQAAVEGS